MPLWSLYLCNLMVYTFDILILDFLIKQNSNIKELRHRLQNIDRIKIFLFEANAGFNFKYLTNLSFLYQNHILYAFFKRGGGKKKWICFCFYLPHSTTPPPPFLTKAIYIKRGKLTLYIHGQVKTCSRFCFTFGKRGETFNKSMQPQLNL